MTRRILRGTLAATLILGGIVVAAVLAPAGPERTVPAGPPPEPDAELAHDPVFAGNEAAIARLKAMSQRLRARADGVAAEKEQSK